MNMKSLHPVPTGAARWWQLCFGVIAMMAVSSPQYVWALFTTDLKTMLNATLPQIQSTFAILIVAQTFLSPFQVSSSINLAHACCFQPAQSLPR